jgi:hypothetical protein
LNRLKILKSSQIELLCEYYHFNILFMIAPLQHSELLKSLLLWESLKRKSGMASALCAYIGEIGNSKRAQRDLQLAGMPIKAKRQQRT